MFNYCFLNFLVESVNIKYMSFNNKSLYQSFSLNLQINIFFLLKQLTNLLYFINFILKSIIDYIIFYIIKNK